MTGPLIEKNAVVLFQGDSITDANRNRNDPASLGGGYAMLATSFFLAQYPTLGVKFINRGISGNRARDLAGRWDTDCIALKPTWVSIMIGVNDTWRRFDSNSITTANEFEDSYRTILQKAKTALNPHFILMEPFVLPHPEDRKQWRQDLDPKIKVTRKLAKEFSAILVRLDKIMNNAAQVTEPASWANDGVHPSLAGHALIAQSWLYAVGAGRKPGPEVPAATETV